MQTKLQFVLQFIERPETQHGVNINTVEILNNILANIVTKTYAEVNIIWQNVLWNKCDIFIYNNHHGSVRR